LGGVWCSCDGMHKDEAKLMYQVIVID
jgi:hypothetical protein